jgi:aquaporin Z
MNEDKSEANPKRTYERVTHKERRWVMIRLVLGVAQIVGATISLVLLIRTGVSKLSIEACVVTTFFTIMSRLLFSTAWKRDDLEKFVPEFSGTFVLVLVGTGAIILNDVTGGGLSNLGIGLAFGSAVMAMVLALGDISGAHINPAVTLGFWIAHRLPSRYVLPYILSQCAGALAASLTLRLLFVDHPTLGATLPSGSAYQSLMLEIIMTCLLMYVILKVSTGAEETGIKAAVAIGAVVVLETFFGWPVSGASMNPARSLAPALVTGRFDYLWIYFLAPVVGAYLAVIGCRCVQGDGCCTKRELQTIVWRKS